PNVPIDGLLDDPIFGLCRVAQVGPSEFASLESSDETYKPGVVAERNAKPVKEASDHINVPSRAVYVSTHDNVSHLLRDFPVRCLAVVDAVCEPPESATKC